MTRTEQDQEYVLGTKQLLSAFFVVVALLGVFFTAGYIIGRNTGPKAGSSDASSNASPGTQAAERTASRGSEPVPEPPVSQITEPVATATAPVTKPKAAEPVQNLDTKPTDKPPAETNAKPTPEMVSAVTSQVGAGHMYLQLMAVKRPVADNMVKLLKGRGYPALLGESSKPELFRVLVGPFTDMASLAKTKSGLKAAGFESVIAK